LSSNFIIKLIFLLLLEGNLYLFLVIHLTNKLTLVFPNSITIDSIRVSNMFSTGTYFVNEFTFNFCLEIWHISFLSFFWNFNLDLKKFISLFIRVHYNLILRFLMIVSYPYLINWLDNFTFLRLSYLPFFWQNKFQFISFLSI